MVKIISSPDCGNSPKREFLKEFHIAMAKGDVDFLVESVVEEIDWNRIGVSTISGKESFAAELKKLSKVKELTLDQILSHGKEGAINGVFSTVEGKQITFSDFYVFN